MFSGGPKREHWLSMGYYENIVAYLPIIFLYTLKEEGFAVEGIS